MDAPTRPLLRYFGGKWMIAPWIISNFPPHRTYVEPFGGAASVLMRKPKSYAEVYNDLDKNMLNLFRVLQNPRHAYRLRKRLEVTPFAREEFLKSLNPPKGAVDAAWKTIVRSLMGFGSMANMDQVTGFRGSSSGSNTSPGTDWKNYAPALPAMIDRLRSVVIENKDAVQLMKYHDRPDTLHYVDPPYMSETRSQGNRYCKKHRYNHEMTDDDHSRLLEDLRSLEGMVVLSGYRSELYDERLQDWQRYDKATFANGGRPRVESIWCSPAVISAKTHAAAFESHQHSLDLMTQEIE